MLKQYGDQQSQEHTKQIAGMNHDSDKGKACIQVAVKTTQACDLKFLDLQQWPGW